ncbi:MAG: aldehyde dehydrogenase family protein, partial [Myxococcota bacterium]
NRVMIKPSEFTPHTSALIEEMISSAYDPTEIAVLNGGPELGAAFSAMPFDHLLFTGSTSVGRLVMRAASEHLVPVTLELGGKSPVFISRFCDLQQATDRILIGKTLNAGQICLAPDYVFVPENRREDFVQIAQRSFKQMYPKLLHNPDYTSVINQKHFERLQKMLDDAQDKGATLVELNPANEDFQSQRHWKMPLTLVLDPTPEMLVLQDEIFGPILPVLTYESIDGVTRFINERPRPLAFYPFSNNIQERNKLLQQTLSGGVTINDVIMHTAIESLPFGGVGPSGMGSYHGYDGFKTFSHARAICTQSPWFDLAGMFRPPFTPSKERILSFMMGSKHNPPLP